jgi:hypothetical protein
MHVNEDIEADYELKEKGEKEEGFRKFERPSWI